MKCPQCSKSLWFVKDVCPFCKTIITPETRAMKVNSNVVVESTHGESMVTLINCGTLVEADAIRGQLEAADIPVFLPDENLMQTIAWALNTYGYVRVQVSSQDYEAAKQLLSSVNHEPSTQLATLPLSWPMRCFAFVTPLLIGSCLLAFAVAKVGYSQQGYERKGTELWHWFAGGVAFWVLGFFVFVFVRGLVQ